MEEQTNEMIRQDETIRLEIVDQAGQPKAAAEDQEQVIMVFEGIYAEGDQIRLSLPQEGHYVVRIDDAVDEALVYMTRRELLFTIPFGEEKRSWSPKAFTGERHYLTCRRAEGYEVKAYRNLAKNVMDQHGDRGCFPHASANVETRGEAVFAAKNAIDGVLADRSHGDWPYGSWGINRRRDAEFKLDFGRPVDIDKIVLYTRADFPHDNWWVRARLVFSDGSQETIGLEKGGRAQVFRIERKQITWIELTGLIPSPDPSPFPALTQIQVYGTES